MFQNYNKHDTTLLPETPLHNFALCLYFERQLMNLIKAQFEFEGVPEEWDYDYFMDTLFLTGKVCILDLPKYGVVPQYCTLSGLNIFGRPSRFLVTNPLLTNTIEGKIHRDGVVVKLFPDYGGFGMTIRAYASRIACAMEAVDVSIVNSKPTIILWAEDQNQAVTLRNELEKAQSGKPFIVLKRNGLTEDCIGMVQPDIAKNYIAPQLLETITDLMSKFKDSVGVFHQNNDKKANLLQAEVDNSQAQVSNQLKLVIDCVQRGLDEANEKYGLNIHIKQCLEAPEGMQGMDDNSGGEQGE